MFRSTSDRGITVIDLLALMIVLVFCLALLMPAAAALQGKRAIVGCDSNLRQIAAALRAYASENKGSFPRVRYDRENAVPVFFTKVDSKDPFEDKDGPVNDVTAAFYLLLRTQMTDGRPFVCPGTDDQTELFMADHGITDQSNFHSRKTLSYSYANPYPTAPVLRKGYFPHNAMNPQFALVADINPGVKELLTTNALAPQEQLNAINSPNHAREGQNVVFADGHVAWQTTPFAGVDQDNIYTFGKSGKTAGGDGIIGSPSGPDDSILLPTDGDVKP